MAGGGALAAVLTLTAGIPVPAASPQPAQSILGGGAPSAIPGSYIVGLKDNAAARTKDVAARARELSARHNGKLGPVWGQSLRGFAVTMDDEDARGLVSDPDVAFVQQNQRFRLEDAETPSKSTGSRARSAAVMPRVQHIPSQDAGAISAASWGLDRIDQRRLPLDGSYIVDPTTGQGAGVHAYIIDSGIRLSHTDLEGRASFGANFADDTPKPGNGDCFGHGTGVASIVGGHQFGVAKMANMVDVRAFDCNSFADDVSIVNSIQYVVDQVSQHRAKHEAWPAVINLTLDYRCADAQNHTTVCPLGAHQGIVVAEQAAVNAGIPVVVGAGDENKDTCTFNPIASTPQVITVGATTTADTRQVVDTESGSDFGPCVDIWAPGESVPAASSTGDTATGTKTGTLGAAAPHVTGAIALLLGDPNDPVTSPSAVNDRLVSASTKDTLTGLGTGSANRLLYTLPATRSGTPVALAHSADDRLALFGVNKDGFLTFRMQSTPASDGWENPVQSKTQGWFSVAAERNSNQLIQLITLTSFPGQVWSRQQTTDNGNTWTNLSQVAGLLTSVAVAPNKDGALTMFGVNQQGEVYTSGQAGVNSPNWGEFDRMSFSGGRMRSVVSETNAAGLIEIFGVDALGRVWHNMQTAVNTDNWTGFAEMTGLNDIGGPMSSIAVARNGNGNLLLIGSQADGGLWEASPLVPGAITNWGIWSLVPSGSLLVHHIVDVTAESLKDGRVRVVGVASNGDIWQNTQNGSSWTGWNLIGSGLRP